VDSIKKKVKLNFLLFTEKNGGIKVSNIQVEDEILKLLSEKTLDDALCILEEVHDRLLDDFRNRSDKDEG
jgi:hypothetical protein